MLLINQWSKTQKSILSITPRCTSFLSIMGSSFIIYTCLISSVSSNTNNTLAEETARTNRNRNRNIERDKRCRSTYNRILIVLSLFDLMSSTGFFLGSWAIPSDDTQGAVGNSIGNNTSCSLQGFLLNTGFLGCSLCNTCLAVNFYLFVKTVINRADHSNLNSITREKRLEFLFHFISIVFPISTTTWLLVNGFMNPTPSYCWIVDYPRRCVELKKECVRAENFKKMRLIFVSIPIAVCIVIILLTVVLIHRTIKDFEAKVLKSAQIIQNDNNTRNNNMSESSKDFEAKVLNSSQIKQNDNNTSNNNISGSQADDQENDNHNSSLQITIASQKVFRLSILYLLVILLCWVPALFHMLFTRYFFDNANTTFVIYLLFQILSPSQGLFNALIYKDFNPITFLCRHLLCISSSTRKDIFSIRQYWSRSEYDVENSALNSRSSL